MKNQTKFHNETGDMTKSQNVNRSILIPTRDSKEETSGVATQKAIKKDRKKVTILVNILYDLLKIYGYDDTRISSSEKKGNNSEEQSKIIQAHKAKTVRDKLKLKELFLQFRDKAGMGSWKDLFKYKINAFFSWVMKQEIPPVPKGLDSFPRLLDPSFLFFGRAKRFLKKLSLDKRKLESFAQSVAQSKKGAPPVSKDMVFEAEKKCFEHLTTPRADMPDFTIFDGWFEHTINRHTVCYQLRRTVREIFLGKLPSWEELTKPFVPSTNSQYNFSRGALGGVGAFAGNEAIIGCVNQASFEKPDSYVKTELGPVVLSGELTEMYGKAGVEDQERIDNDFENVKIKETLGLHFDGSKLTELWRDHVYPTMIREAVKEEPQTMVIGLPEPLKVRCITAGPPITYAVLKPFQKWLWRTLKDQSCFQLIGTPVTIDIVKQKLGRLGHDEEFISGDYKASTDNLHSWVSECLLEALDEVWTSQIESKEENDAFAFWKDQIVTLMKRALTGHKIMDPEYNESYRKGHDIPESAFRLQREGQLMGSIISFPFLCLANAALCRWAMEITDRKNYKLVDRKIQGYEPCRLLVNGDDCVFPGMRDLMFENWQNITAFGGLESSVGKTFKSRDFMTINSVQYQYTTEITDWEQTGGTFNEDFFYNDIKYVNLGLVYGQKKDGIRGKPFYRLGAVHRDLFRTCPPELFTRATKLFMKECSQTRYKTSYKKVDNKTVKIKTEDFFGNIRNSQVPYFMPEWLGGLGLVKTKDSQINEWDLKVASVIRQNQGDFKIIKLKENSLWQFHSLVDKRLEDYLFLGNQNYRTVEYQQKRRNLGSEYQKLYSLCVVDQLLTKNVIQLTSDIEADQDKFLRNNHIQNMKIWKRLRSNQKLSGLVASQRPALYEDILQEKKEFCLSCFDMTPEE